MVKAAELLAGEYTLVATNVPYLGPGKQDDAAQGAFGEPLRGRKSRSSHRLRCAVSRVLCPGRDNRARHACRTGLFLASYRKLRESLLKHRTWNIVARLGPGAFETIGGHVVNVALLGLSATKPGCDTMAGIDVSAAKLPAEKAALLRGDASGPDYGCLSSRTTQKSGCQDCLWRKQHSPAT